jgi:hypothetical protein
MRHYSLVVIAAVVLILIEYLFHETSGASLLVALLFWASVGHGIIALVVAADLAYGEWIRPVKESLLDIYPYLLLPPIVFIAHSFHLSGYPWYDHNTVWLTPGFFIGRSIVLLLLAYFLVHLYIQALKKGSSLKGFWGVLYLLTVVAAFSLMAFDWVMSLEYPWINTLFGGFFLVEALFVGAAVCAIYCSLLYLRQGEAYFKVMRDFVLLTLGFSLFWIGLFYAQFLTIWYGNLPEEVAFVFKRMDDPTYYKIGAFAVITMWAIPFTSFITKKAKETPVIIWLLTICVFAGYIMEKVFYVDPVMDVNPIFLPIYLIVLGIPFLALMRRTVQ